MPSRAPVLTLDPEVVAAARRLAARAGQPVVELARTHTTVSVERALLRLGGLGGAGGGGGALLRRAGLAGADVERVPWVNSLVDAVRADVGIEHGVALPVWDALLREDVPDLLTLAQKASSGAVRFRLPEGRDARRAGAAARRAAAGGLRAVDRRRMERERLVRRLGDPPRRP